MPGPLTGTRIIDTSERSPAAAITGMILSDYGAEVIHVEPPGGDPLRGIPGSRVWLRGQKSVVISPASIADGSWARLLASADVILHTDHGRSGPLPASLDGWEPADHQILTVLTARPRPAAEAAMAGPGERPAYGELIEAEFGCMHLQEGHREGPIFLGWPHAVYGGAWLLQIGILAALYERAQSGLGQIVTTSLLDGLAILNPNRWIGGKAIEGERFTRSVIGRRGNRKHVVAIFECADGRWIHVHTGPRGAFDRLLRLIDRDDLIDDGTKPEVAGVTLPPELADSFWDHMHRTFKSKPAQHWVDLFNAHDVACMPVVLAGEALKLDQTRANGMVATTPDGRIELGVVTKFARTPAAAGVGVPAPGEHNTELLAESAPAPAAPPERPGARPDGSGPLAGLTVLDLGNVLAAPFSARMLGDLGARVIKVEEVAGQAGRVDQWVLRLTTERGKECIGLNLKAPEGREILYDLVRQADALVTNMRMAALEKLSIDDASLRRINPRLVYCHSAGYGTAGPWGKLPAFGVLHTALSGVMDRSAGRGNPPLHALASLDYASGLTTAVSMLAALLERERSGLGQFLEVIQLGSAGLLAMSDVYFEADGTMSDSYALDPEQRGPAPTNALYRTRDGWIVIACYGEDEWRQVPAALGVDAAGWPSYAAARREPLDASAAGKAIVDALGGLTTDEARHRLEAAGVPCALPRPYEADDLVDEPDLRDLRVIETVTHPEIGPMFEVAQTMRFDRTPPPERAPAHRHAQDSFTVARSLGRSDADLTAWADAKIVATGAAH